MKRRSGGGRPLDGLGSLCERSLFGVVSTQDLFNPYADEYEAVDVTGAAAIRRENLLGYFRAYVRRPAVMVVAEAPGPWGCRFSGVPITSEEQLADPGFPLSGEKSGSQAEPHAEYSARIFWRAMQRYFPSFFVWNAVPLHPHPVGEPLSIRTPRVAEIRSFAELTGRMIEVVGPRVVVALGRKAEFQVGEVLGEGCVYVRHPSQGGATAFRDGMARLFESMV